MGAEALNHIMLLAIRHHHLQLPLVNRCDSHKYLTCGHNHESEEESWILGRREVRIGAQMIVFKATDLPMSLCFAPIEVYDLHSVRENESPAKRIIFT